MTNTVPDIRRLRRILGLGGSLFIAVLVLGVAVTLWIDHAETLEGAERTALALTRALDEHVVRTTEEVDTVLFALARRLGEPGDPSLPVEETLRRWVAHLPQTRALMVFDAEGRLQHRWGPGTETLPARAVWQSLWATPLVDDGSELHIGAPLIAPDDDRPILTLCRHIESAAGHDGGAVAAIVAPPDLSAFYGALEVGPGGSLGLFHVSGALLAATPAPDGAARLSAPAATVLVRTAATPIGVTRMRLRPQAEPVLLAHRFLERLPFVVAVALDERTVLTPWYQNAVRMIGFVGTACLALIAALVLLQRHIGRQHRAEAELSSRFQRERLVRAVSESLVALLPEDMDARVTAALGLLGRFLEVQMACLYETSEGDEATPNGELGAGRLRVRYHWSAEAEPSPEVEGKLPDETIAWLQTCLQSAGAVALSRLADLPGHAEAETQRQALAAAGIEALLMVPLWAGQGLQGCIGVAQETPGRRWSDADQDLLAVIGQIIAAALDRGRVLNQMRNQRLWLETLINAMPDIVCFKDGQGRWLVANAFNQRLFQLTEVDYRDKTDRELAACTDFHRDTLALLAETDALTWQTGGPTRREEAIPCPDGPDMVFDVIKVPLFNADGSRKGLVVVGRDITRRKRFERELRAANERIEVVLNSIDAIIYVADLDTQEVIMVNDTARQTFGEGIGKSCWAFLACANDPKHCDACQTQHLFRPDGAPAGTYVTELFHPGNKRWYLCRNRAIRWSDGRLVRLQMATDITERKAAEVQLAQAKQQAEAASQAKSRFLATMSHELRTPLNSILGFSEMIRDELMGPIETPAYVDYAGHIFVSGRHLLDLISDILDLSKIEAGKFELERVTLSIAHLVQSLLSLTRERAARQELTLDTHMPARLPPLYADERAAKQVLFNLISNAIKYTQPGGRIVIGAEPAGDGGVVLSVTDTGIGIPSGQIDRVLRPFEQVDNRYSRAFGGTGLGLSLVKGLMELHGGWLRLDSAEGIGTTARVGFPPNPGAAHDR